MYTAMYDQNYIYTKEGFPFSGCMYSSGYNVCTGRRTLAAIYPQYWNMVAGFDFSEKQGLNLNVSLNLTYFETYKSHCEPFHNRICDSFVDYSYTSYPNPIGQSSVKEANGVLAFIHTILNKEELCYQHTYEFVCRISIPECRNQTMIYPCKQMCQDVNKACGDLMKEYHQILFCINFKDSLNSSECFYKPVRCPVLDLPQSGTVFTSGLGVLNNSTYRCNNAFSLEGDDTRTCLYTGEWSGTAPVCEPARHTTLIIVVSVLILVIFTLLIACLYYRNTIKLLILHNIHADAMRLDNLPAQKSLFVTFSSQDLDHVDNVFLPRLRQELPTWKIQTYQKDFVPGRPLLECMREGVWESQAMLVLLTENYVASSMCKYEFTEAQTRMVMDKTFKLIVILFYEENIDAVSIEGMSDDLKKYLRARVYLQLGEVLFWNKLRRALVI